jgi:CMP-N-acetylneuraminic acid synthetase
MLVAVILARGGSERLPGKNLMQIDGVSLTGRAIACAKECLEVDLTVLSTDDEAIATEGFRHGAVVLKRPDYLATSEASSAEAVLHALQAIGISGATVALLQPTSPLRRAEDVNAALIAYRNLRPEVVVSVNPDGELNGAVYVTDTKALRRYRSFDMPEVVKITMPAKRSIDVDTAADFARASQALNWDG